MDNTIKTAGTTLLTTFAMSTGKKIVSRLGFSGVAKLALFAGVGYLAYQHFAKDEIDTRKEIH